MSHCLTWSLTLFGRAHQHHAAVHALELVEVGPHFDLVLGALEQVGEDGAPLRGRLHVLRLPQAAAATGPVHQPIALDVLGLTVHLR